MKTKTLQWLLISLLAALLIEACGPSDPGADSQNADDDDVVLSDDDGASDDDDVVLSDDDGASDDDTSPADDDRPTDDDAQSDDDAADDDDADDDTMAGCIEPYVGLVVTGDTVICPGEYELDSANGPVITVAGSHLTLTGEGVTLIGAAAAYGSGINLVLGDVRDVLIQGFTLRNYYYGVYGLGNYQAVRFTGLSIEDPAYAPFDVGASGTGSCQLTLDNIAVTDSRTTGITLRDCTDSLLRAITYTNTTVDVIESNVILMGGEHNTIEDSYFSSVDDAGCNAIWLSDSRFNVIQNNILDLDFKDGSHLLNDASENVFRNNTFLLHSSQKIFDIPADCRANQIYGNTFVGGLLDDRAPDTVFCVDGVGNSYEDDASYQGASPTDGTCP